MSRILVATRNPTKVNTLASLLAGHDVCEAPVDVTLDHPEDGVTFAANAIAKAEAVSAHLPGEIIVATDGGLLVPALGGAWEPLRTHRFGGTRASSADRARSILRLAGDLGGLDRAIGWHEALAVAVAGRHEASWVAESPPGELATTLHESLLGADRGFWVSAIWRCPECAGKRLADLTHDERATRLDHWMQLGAALSGWLAEHELEADPTSASKISSRPVL